MCMPQRFALAAQEDAYGIQKSTESCSHDVICLIKLVLEKWMFIVNLKHKKRQKKNSRFDSSIEMVQ